MRNKIENQRNEEEIEGVNGNRRLKWNHQWNTAERNGIEKKRNERKWPIPEKANRKHVSYGYRREEKRRENREIILKEIENNRSGGHISPRKIKIEIRRKRKIAHERSEEINEGKMKKSINISRPKCFGENDIGGGTLHHRRNEK